MSDPAIFVQNAGKAYRIWKTPGARLTGPVWSTAGRLLPTDSAIQKRVRDQATKAYRDFWALQDVSFELRRGESLGIIGRNGSGKSTLLQIIAGTLQPTTGEVKVNGRVAALLELGSGFNPEFTGRENVYLNATVLGLKREEIDARYEDIARFAEIGDFIDQPVKTYSSGMVVRLAFAVAAHVNPDILIIDEALSVGDARFQLKCARAIDRFVSQGVTLLFVSHDSSAVKRLCRHALLLEHGRLIYKGKPNDVTNLYSKLIADGGSVEALQPDIQALRNKPVTAAMPAPFAPTAVPSTIDSLAPTPAASQGANAETAALHLRVKALELLLRERPDGAGLAKKVEALLYDERAKMQITGQEFSYGGELGAIREITIEDEDGQARTWFTTGEHVVARCKIESFEDFPEPIFALTIKNTAGVEIYGTNTFFSCQPARPIKSGEQRLVTFSFPIDLMPGHYFLSLGFTHFVGEQLVVVHRRYDTIKLEVHGVDRTFGIANLHAKIEETDLPVEETP